MSQKSFDGHQEVVMELPPLRSEEADIL
jgi:hypothetical protein